MCKDNITSYICNNNDLLIVTFFFFFYRNKHDFEDSEEHSRRIYILDLRFERWFYRHRRRQRWQNIVFRRIAKSDGGRSTSKLKKIIPMPLLLFSKINRDPQKLRRNNLLKIIIIYDVYRFELTFCPSIFPYILYFLALTVTEMQPIRYTSLHRQPRSLKA